MRHLRQLRIGAMVAPLFLIILAACGGGGGATPTPGQSVSPTASTTATPAPTGATSTVDACTLLTVAEVAAAVPDAEIATATSSSDIYYAYCTYSGYSEVKMWVTIDATVADSIFSTIKINAGVAVTGVGDDAFWSTDSFQPGLYFMKGSVVGYISGAQTGPEQNIIDLGVLLASRI
jgi:hypothetical protein